MLSDGQSSRIYQKLVYDKQIAVAAFGGANLIEDPNLFYAVAIVQPGHTPEEAVEALIGELERLKSEPISEHDLQRTKNQFARDYILGARVAISRRRCSSRMPPSSTTTSRRADGEFEIFQNIKAADVQRVARTYFTAENRLVLTLDAVGARVERTGGPMTPLALMTRPTTLAMFLLLRAARGDAIRSGPGSGRRATAAPPGRWKGRRVRWRRET